MKVLGLGDNVVDKYVHIHTMYPGGNALNFSVYAKQLGVDSAYLGVFGSDEEAKHVQAVLKELEIDLSRCRLVEGENGCARVTIEDGDRIFLGSNSGGVLKTNNIKLSPEDLEYIRGFDLVHTSIYSYMEDELVKLKQTGIAISFDFSDDFTEEYLKQVCPQVDYSFLSCSHLTEEKTIELLKRVCGLGSRLAVGTRGSEGALLYNGSVFYRQSPNPVEAVDTLGAGDSMITAFLISYQQGKGISSALQAGAAFAAETCLVDGAFGFGKVYNE